MPASGCAKRPALYRPRRPCTIPSMKRRRSLLLLGLLAASFALGVRGWMLWPYTAITRGNAAMISEGMTLAEIEEILGGPARNESGLPDNFIRDAFVNGDMRGVAEKRWASPGFLVIVEFDWSWQVIRQSNVDFNVDASPFHKLRRWLRL